MNIMNSKLVLVSTAIIASTSVFAGQPQGRDTLHAQQGGDTSLIVDTVQGPKSGGRDSARIAPTMPALTLPHEVLPTDVMQYGRG